MDGDEVRHSLHNEEFVRRSIKRQTNRVLRGASVVEDEFVPTVDEIGEGIRASVANGGVVPHEADTIPTGSRWEEFIAEIRLPKWRILGFICMLTFGKQYVFDFPSSFGVGLGNTIQHHFNEEGKDYDNTMNQALYSVYSYPNTVLALVGGILIDRVLGLRKSVLLFSCLISGGTFFFWLGVHLTQYPIMVLGRFLVGLGGESMTVAKTAFLARWFAGGKGMSFACSMTIALTRIAASMNFVVSPAVARSGYGASGACLVGVAICAFATLSTVLLVVCDLYFEKKGYVKVRSLGGTGEGLCSRLLTMLKQMIKLPVQFWLICGSCVCIYAADYPFIGFAKTFFEQKWGFSSAKAGLCLSIYQIALAVFSPVGGAVIDKIGRHVFVMLFCAFSFVTLHVLMATTYITPFAVVIILGAVFALVVPALWPTIPAVVDPTLVAVGFGIMTSIQNIGMASVPLVVGVLLDANPVIVYPVNGTTLPPSDDDGKTATTIGYNEVEWMMAGFSLMGVCLTVMLAISDRMKTGVLTVSPALRVERLAQIDEAREQVEKEEERRSQKAQEEPSPISVDDLNKINKQWDREHRKLLQKGGADTDSSAASERSMLLNPNTEATLNS